VRFGPTQEQADLRDAVRALASSSSPSADAPPSSAWISGALEIGLPGLVIPDRYGGSGADSFELSLVHEELGRKLAFPGLLPSTVASMLLLESGDVSACERYLPSIAGGTLRFSLPVVHLGSAPSRQSAPTVEMHSDGPRVTGCVPFVADAALADVVIIMATVGGEPGLFTVERPEGGFSAAHPEALDLTRPLGQLDFDNAPALPIECVDTAGALRRTNARAAILASAEQVGGAQACLEMSVDYASTRRAFGQPIGAFQAVKHRCADMYVQVETARAVSWQAAWEADSPGIEIEAVAALAKPYCSEVFSAVAAGAIQVLGAIGFTWESAAHLYLRRARADAELFGSVAAWRDRGLAVFGM
jgi:alkylation response protein AidB-like acyl-CoA dehydrogenase